MRALSQFVILVSVLLVTGLANAQSKPMSFEQWEFLVGDWIGVGHGTPGEGKGSFSFTFDLQNKVIIRKAHTDYPPAAGRPAFAHDDLMVIYADDAANKFRADYYDNEGHVIRYTAEFSADGQSVVFVSEPVLSQPRFRLSYFKAKQDELGIKFEIAPPNEAENFKVYLEGTARKDLKRALVRFSL